MMKKYIVYSSIALLLISGCSKPNNQTQEQDLQPFSIQIERVKDLTTSNTIVKSGILVGTQAITVSSQVNGRVQNIGYNAGETVNANTVIVELNDSSGNYTFNAQRAKTQLDSARINYDSTIISLEKNIKDSSLSIQQAQTQYNAANQGGQGSTALQIEQLNQQVAKAELDYQTQLDSNQQTINNFIASAENIGRDVALLFDTVRIETDLILGVSQLYERENDNFERHLGARNTETRRLAMQSLRTLLANEAAYANLSQQVEEGELTVYLSDIKDLLYDLLPVLEDTDVMLEYTTTSTNLTQTALDGLSATIDGLQNQVQAQISSITAQVNTIQSFLSTYKQQEESLRQQVEITKQQVAATKSSLRDGEINATIGLESAENTYETVLQNKENTLASLANSIEQARIAYNEAQAQLGKFSVETPIQGTIGEVLVDEGQEVNVGTPLFTISSSNKQQVEIALSQEDLSTTTVGQEVTIHTKNATYAGTIQSISNIADQNFTYTAIISLQDTEDFFGDVVEVHIPVRTAYALVPINVVTILKRNEGLINIWEDNTIIQEKVTFGKIWGEYVEITSELEENIHIIISDISNFNPNKQKIVIE